MGTATISSKNQITLPADIRAMFQLKPGDKVVLAREGGHAVLRPIPRTDFLAQAAKLAPLLKGVKLDVPKARAERLKRRFGQAAKA
jgi:AbrB family looped-hinge helix DNA binding protein